MNPRVRQVLLFVIVCSLLGVGVLALIRYKQVQSLRLSEYLPNQVNLQVPEALTYAQAVEKVKEDRAGSGGAAIEVPTQLRHYEERQWFLATQVAEVEKFGVPSSQDFVDLSALLALGELVPLPAVTETYVLYGVGARADDGAFSRFVDDQDIPVYNETELRDAYARLDSARQTLETQISNIQFQLKTLKKGERARQRELQKELAAHEQELEAKKEEKTLLDGAYGSAGNRQIFLRDYESLQKLARNFAGRSFNLDDPRDRHALKLAMLSALRPQALKILEEVAKAYKDKFARPLPVSSLVRPEQYQRALRKVNRNATLIDTPPHSTGLAFDIDYRYMSGEEQNFLMTELARLKDEGRIEVLRERSANLHVFAFIDGKRPADRLVAAAVAAIEEDRDAARAPAQQSHHATRKPVERAVQSQSEKTTRTSSKASTNSKAKASSKAKKRRMR